MNGRSENGIFIKIPNVSVIEILGRSGLDFGVVDAEHAPFDRCHIDQAMVAAAAVGWKLFVRVSENRASDILNALDLGAVGVVVPHVDSPEAARMAVAAARFRAGSRGFSGATRHAGYGTIPLAQSVAAGDSAKVIVQIEHPEGFEQAEAIAATEGVSGILVGRADLAVAMGMNSATDPEIQKMTAHLLRLANRKGILAGVAAASVAEAQQLRDIGANWIILSSDQGLLRGASAAAAQGLSARSEPVAAGSQE
jgi:2-keto-3-deoxy-L-rhamnonate aldolase RhmA